jgi:hypothetical protein
VSRQITSKSHAGPNPCGTSAGKIHCLSVQKSLVTQKQPYSHTLTPPVGEGSQPCQECRSHQPQAPPLWHVSQLPQPQRLLVESSPFARHHQLHQHPCQHHHLRDPPQPPAVKNKPIRQQYTSTNQKSSRRSSHGSLCYLLHVV